MTRIVVLVALSACATGEGESLDEALCRRLEECYPQDFPRVYKSRAACVGMVVAERAGHCAEASACQWAIETGTCPAHVDKFYVPDTCTCMGLPR